MRETLSPKDLFDQWVKYLRECERFRTNHQMKGYLQMRGDPEAEELNTERLELNRLVTHMLNPKGELTGVSVFSQKFWSILGIIPEKWPPA